MIQKCPSDLCGMYGLVVIEVMTMSGHLSNIDEIKTGAEKSSVLLRRLVSFFLH
jgi:hypothetical protein